MIAMLIWSLAGVVIFLSNHYHWTEYIGIRFTERLVGFPISGGWLCAALALYCLVRFFVRRQRKKQESRQSAE